MSASALRRSRLDGRLPGLDALFDTDGSAARFATAWDTDVADCRLLATRYEPGVRCVATYALTTPMGPAVGVVELTPDDAVVRRAEDDPELPGLRDATDPSAVAALLDVPGCAVTVVRYRPGERAVLRYDVHSPAGPGVLFGKVVKAGAAELAGVFADLHSRALAGDGPFVPAPVAVAERLGLLVLPAVDGPSLHAIAFDPASSMAERGDAFRLAGRALAQLHDGPPPPDAVALADDVAELEGAAGALRAIDPLLAERWAVVLVELAAVGASSARIVPSHGALRTDQVVLTSSGPALLDLDGFCAAPPARDLGNLLAYLRWRAMRRPDDAEAAALGRGAVVAGYEELAAPPDDLPCYEALSLLKIAARRYRSLDMAEWALVPDLVEAAAALVREGVTAALAGALGPGVGRVHDIEVLEHKPGRRALLRYDTDGAGTVYGKAFSELASAKRTLALMEQVAAAVEPVGWAAPRPLGLVPALGLVLYEPLLGPSLDALVGTDGMLDALEGAGRWLATLHGSGLDLPRVLDPQHEATNAAAWGGLAGEAFPDLAATAERLTVMLARSVPASVGAPVPIHKDFHYQHVITGARLGVVDVDEARMGDPRFDVGHFRANLELLAHRCGLAPDARDRWMVAFTSACGFGPGDEESLRWYEAYTCVKLAKQLATGQGPRPRPEGDARHAEVEWALAHGLSVMAP